MNDSIIMLFALFVFGYVVPAFILMAVGAYKDVDGERTGWRVLSLKLLWTSIPAVTLAYYLFYKDALVGEEPFSKFCGYGLFAFLASIPLSVLAKHYAKQIPVFIASLFKELPYILFCGAFAAFMTIGVFLQHKNGGLKENPFGVVFILGMALFVWLIVFGGAMRNILKSLIVQLKHQKLPAKITKCKVHSSRSFELIYLEYRVRNGHVGWCFVCHGMYGAANHDHLSSSVVGSEIEVYYSPVFGGVSYYNRR